MGESWFRLHTCMIRDPKILRLNHTQRWQWIILLTLCRESGLNDGRVCLSNGSPYTISELAREMDVRPRAVRTFLDKAEAVGIIDRDTEGMVSVKNWKKRQFVTDEPIENQSRTIPKPLKNHSEAIEEPFENHSRTIFASKMAPSTQESSEKDPLRIQNTEYRIQNTETEDNTIACLTTCLSDTPCEVVPDDCPPPAKPAKPQKPVPPYAQIQETFNRLCPSLPRVVQMPQKRKDKIRARWQEWGESMGLFEEICRRVQASGFLTGRETRWKASFDWLVVNEENWVKVMEGNYTRGSPALDTAQQVMMELREEDEQHGRNNPF